MFENKMRMEPLSDDEIVQKNNNLTQKALSDMAYFLKENVSLIGKRGIDREIEKNILAICRYVAQAVQQKNVVGMEYTELAFLPEKKDEDVKLRDGYIPDGEIPNVLSVPDEEKKVR